MSPSRRNASSNEGASSRRCSETFVALDQTLTRIAAEEGHFPDAYRSYMSAVTAHFAEGISHAPDGYTAADFEGMTEAMVARFAAYRDRVEREWDDARRRTTRRRFGV